MAPLTDNNLLWSKTILKKKKLHNMLYVRKIYLLRVYRHRHTTVRAYASGIQQYIMV